MDPELFKATCSYYVENSNTMGGHLSYEFVELNIYSSSVCDELGFEYTNNQGLLGITIMDVVHFMLDTAGWVPAIGEVADAVNGVIYMIEDEIFAAALSFGAAILPVVGDIVFKSLKFTLKTTSQVMNKILDFISPGALDYAISTLRQTVLDVVAKFISTGSSLYKGVKNYLDDFLNLFKGKVDDTVQSWITKCDGIVDDLLSTEVIPVEKIDDIMSRGASGEFSSKQLQEIGTRIVDGATELQTKMIQEASESLMKIENMMGDFFTDNVFDVSKFDNIIANSDQFSKYELEIISSKLDNVLGDNRKHLLNSLIEGTSHLDYLTGSTADVIKHYSDNVIDNVKVSGTYGSSLTDSTILKRELLASGVTDTPFASQAHHIVAAGDNSLEAVNARKILADCGVDINSAANGVLLPNAANLAGAGTATIHRGRNGGDYLKSVYNALVQANPTDARTASAVLDDIREQLLEGTLKINNAQ